MGGPVKRVVVKSAGRHTYFYNAALAAIKQPGARKPQLLLAMVHSTQSVPRGTFPASEPDAPMLVGVRVRVLQVGHEYEFA